MTPIGMKKNKNNGANVVFAILALLVVVYLSYNMGAGVYDTNVYDKTVGIESESWQKLSLIFTNFLARCEKNPFEDFLWCDEIKTALIWGIGGWFIALLAIYNSKKNYIHGKEFGTARWGMLKDIADLFAVNIMKGEIKQAKKLRTKLGRWLAKRKAEKKCRENANEIKLVRMNQLDEWAQAAKENKTYSRSEYKRRKRLIEEQTAEDYESAFREAWRPAMIEWQYEQDKAEIEAEAQKGLTIANPAQKEQRLQQAKKDRDKSLKSFYSYKGKVAKIKAKYENADELCTNTERTSIYNYKINNNTLILGGSGSGKTRGYVLPNILQAHSSYVVTDPKGEILEKSGYFLETVKGYKIHVLNLDNKSGSDGYNPFAYIHPERSGYEERVLSLIEAIIINTDGGEKKGGSDPFWDKAERLFLQAVFFFTCEGFVEEEQNMNTVLKLIGMLKIEEENDNHDSDLDYFAQILERKLNDADTVNHNAGTMNIGIQQYKEFREKASGKTAKSIVISAVARLAPFRAPEVRRIFSYDTMHLERLGEEKTAIFVVVPPTDPTFNFIAGILFTQMFQELQYCATQVHKHDGQRLPVPVRFILDEFANTCTIPQFVKILAYARSFGIGIVPILQSLEQIKNMYKDEWGVIVDNCNKLLYLGSITHMDTLEYMSKLLGKGTFDKRTTGRTKGKSGSFSQNYDVVGRELMDASEIRKLPKKNCLLVVGGRDPFFSDKYDLTLHPNYRYTSDANNQYCYEYVPPKPPVAAQSKPEAQENVRPRGEDETAAQQEASNRVKAIMESMDKELGLIEFVSNPQQLLNIVSRDFHHLAPTKNDIVSPSFGEEIDYDILDALGYDEADRKVDSILSAESEARSRVAEIRKQADEKVEQEGVKITTDPVEIGKAILASNMNLAPTENDVISPSFGEENDDSFVFEDESGETAVDDDIGDMSQSIESLFASIEAQIA